MASKVSPSRGEATRTDIIKVSRRLFSKHGYSSTGISDIQEATGLTKGAFYHHFRTKEDLALAVLEEARSDYAQHLIEPAMQEPSPGKQLRALLDNAVVLNCQPEWCNCQMLMTLSAEMPEESHRLREAVQQMQSDLFELYEKLITEAQQSGEARNETDPAVWAQWIINTMSGSLLARKIGSARVGPDRLIALIKDFLFGESDQQSQ